MGEYKVEVAFAELQLISPKERPASRHLPAEPFDDGAFSHMLRRYRMNARSLSVVSARSKRTAFQYANLLLHLVSMKCSGNNAHVAVDTYLR